MYFVVAHKSDSESRAHKQSKFQSRGIEELSLRRLHRYVIWNFVMSIVYKWITNLQVIILICRLNQVFLRQRPTRLEPINSRSFKGRKGNRRVEPSMTTVCKFCICYVSCVCKWITSDYTLIQLYLPSQPSVSAPCKNQ